jgi:predicted metal-dependent HD superfamily phosphohydrolase
MPWYDKLVQLYSEPHRHYHNGRHIADCLREFDSARELTRDPFAVELAIWFHDAVYDPRAPDNEEKSATLARQCLAEAAAAPNAAGSALSLADSVERLVLATKHHDSSDTDARLLVDVDLSILGQLPDRFWRYEEEIRREYEWVPEMTFRQKRAEILERFLKREKIYFTQHFFEKYEEQARLNLSSSIKALRDG